MVLVWRRLESEELKNKLMDKNKYWFCEIYEGKGEDGLFETTIKLFILKELFNNAFNGDIEEFIRLIAEYIHSKTRLGFKGSLAKTDKYFIIYLKPRKHLDNSQLNEVMECIANKMRQLIRGNFTTERRYLVYEVF